MNGRGGPAELARKFAGFWFDVYFAPRQAQDNRQHELKREKEMRDLFNGIVALSDGGRRRFVDELDIVLTEPLPNAPPPERADQFRVGVRQLAVTIIVVGIAVGATWGPPVFEALNTVANLYLAADSWHMATRPENFPTSSRQRIQVAGGKMSWPVGTDPLQATESQLPAVDESEDDTATDQNEHQLREMRKRGIRQVDDPGHASSPGRETRDGPPGESLRF